MTFEAVLCDLDGVLRRWPSMADLEQAHGVPRGTPARPGRRRHERDHPAGVRCGQMGLMDHVDGIVNSARLKAAKPDRKIDLAATELAGVPPESCLFVDDSVTNTEAARALGMTAHHFTGALGLREVLASRGW